MNNTQLIDDAGRFVSQYMNEHREKKLLYHNLDHTRSVVSSALQIANHYQLNDRDFLTVILAAWFHDIGYYQGLPTGHEQRGADMAADFLKVKDIDPRIPEQVRRCILATKMPQDPSDLLEQIVCDADLFHLGTDDFLTSNKLLRKEMEITYGKPIAKDEWRRSSIQLLEKHHYQTDYCKLLLSEKKQENINRLKSRLAESVPQHPQQAANSENEEQSEKREKATTPSRGIETMFRITSGNNQRLSDMADNKAHILITVNSIILSAIISLLLRKLEESSFLTYPTFTLLGVSVVTIVVAIIATRPSIPHGTFTQQEIDDKRVNLLFFGNFYRMNLDDYSAGMRRMMTDSDFLYGTLIRDIYAQGVVLGRKYRLLRISYNIFMFGLIVSVLGFAAVFVWFK